MKKNKDINILKLNFYITENGLLKTDLKVLEFFDEDLTKKQKNKIMNKINELNNVLCDILLEQENNIDDCLNCKYCLPIGEGDHICEKNPHKMVLEDYTPTDDFNWCNFRGL